MKKILFVCSANRFRSVIAAEYFKYLLQQKNRQADCEVASAGTWAVNGMPPIPEAVKFARSKGLTIDAHRSREVTAKILEEVDLIIVMSEGQREALRVEFPEMTEKIFLLSEICEGEAYDIPDPTEDENESYEEVATEICTLLYNNLNKMCSFVLDNSRNAQTSDSKIVGEILAKLKVRRK